MRIGPIFLAMKSRELEGCQFICEFQLRAGERAEGGMEEGREGDLPAVHIFHTHDDVAFIEEGPVERDDVRRMALVHDMQLSHNLLPHRRLYVYMDNLRHPQLAINPAPPLPRAAQPSPTYLLGHHRLCGRVDDHADGPAVPRAQFIDHFQVLCSKV